MSGLGFGAFGGQSGDGINPINGIAGGLGAAIQGFLQGHQMRLQNQQQQEALKTQQLNNSLGIFKMLGGIAQSDPNALNNPQMQGWLKQNIGQGGIPLPTNATGQIDVNAFLPALSALTGGARFPEFNQYAPGSVQRKEILAGFGGPQADRDALLNAPQQYTSAQIDNAATTYRYYQNLIANGADPAQLVPAMNAAALRSGDPLLQITPDGRVIPKGGTTALGMGAKTAAQIGSLNARTDYKRKQTSWLDRMNGARVDEIVSKTGLNREMLAEMPQRLAVAFENAGSNALRAQTSANAFADAHAAFQQLGTTPAALSAYNGLLSGAQKAINDGRIAVDSTRNALNGFLALNPNAATADPSSPLGKQYARLHGQYMARNQALYLLNQQNKALIKNHAAFAATVHQAQKDHATNQAHQAGLPNSMRVTKPGVASQGPITQAQLRAAMKQYHWTMQEAVQNAIAHGYKPVP